MCSKLVLMNNRVPKSCCVPWSATTRYCTAKQKRHLCTHPPYGLSETGTRQSPRAVGPRRRPIGSDGRIDDGGQIGNRRLRVTQPQLSHAPSDPTGTILRHQFDRTAEVGSRGIELVQANARVAAPVV